MVCHSLESDVESSNTMTNLVKISFLYPLHSSTSGTLDSIRAFRFAECANFFVRNGTDSSFTMPARRRTQNRPGQGGFFLCYSFAIVTWFKRGVPIFKFVYYSAVSPTSPGRSPGSASWCRRGFPLPVPAPCAPKWPGT